MRDAWSGMVGMLLHRTLSLWRIGSENDIGNQVMKE